MRSENFLSMLFPYFIVQISQCTFFLLLRLFSEEEPNVSNGANLASTITTFQKMERKETWTHCDDPGWFSGFRTFMFPIAASLNKNRDFLAGFSSSSFLSKGSGFELWWLFYGKRASFYFAATAFFLLAVQWRRTLVLCHQDLYVTRWFLTKLLSRFRPPYVRVPFHQSKRWEDQLFWKQNTFAICVAILDYTRNFLPLPTLKVLFIDDFQFVYQCNFRQARTLKLFIYEKVHLLKKKYLCWILCPYNWKSETFNIHFIMHIGTVYWSKRLPR